MTVAIGSSAPATPLTRRAATLQGVAAILLWSSLASITSSLPSIPPFQLAAVSFALATAVGVAIMMSRGVSLAVLSTVDKRYCLLGVYGLLGYHAAYFYALQNAPPVEANLINYLWPLLIVLFTGALPTRLGGGGLSASHVIGAALGFAATALLLAPSAAGNGTTGHWGGYAAALLAAVIWSSYSVSSRFFARVDSYAVTVTCALTTIGAGALHLVFEHTVWSSGAWTWIAMIVQGLGPVGIAFYLWDNAMKHGDLRLLGVLAYATPVLSTALLAMTGQGTLSPHIWLAAGLITAGAVVASRPSVNRGSANG